MFWIKDPPNVRTAQLFVRPAKPRSTPHDVKMSPFASNPTKVESSAAATNNRFLNKDVINVFLRFDLVAILVLPILKSSSKMTRSEKYFVSLLPPKTALISKSYTRSSLQKKAGNGNRTRMASLEGWNFTIKLCPRLPENLPDPRDLPSAFCSSITALPFTHF